MRIQSSYSSRVISLKVLGVVLLLSAFPLASCGNSGNPAEERARRAREATGDIIVGAAWPWEARKNILYKQGMIMAVEEINQEGGVLGRKLKIVYRDDQESVSKGRMVAQRFADNPNVVAVIGHLQSFITLPAAAIYDRAGLLLLAPSSTTPELTQRGYSMVFRLTFSDAAVGRKLADFAARRGYQRVIICYMGNEYGRVLANAFEDQARERGITIVGRQSYNPNIQGGSQNLLRIVSRWTGQDFDAIFLAGEVPLATMIIAKARSLGITAPVIGSDAVGAASLIEVGGKAVEGTVVPYSFHPDEFKPRVQDFVTSFKQRYGVEPGGGAASAYDAIHLLVYAMEKAGSTVPSEIAEALRATERWQGVMGTFAFDEKGNLISQSIKLKVVEDGQFIPLNRMNDDRLAQHRPKRQKTSN